MRTEGERSESGRRSAGPPGRNPNPRLNEWFVPSWGPLRLRTAIGLLFLPYTGMVLSFTVMGGMLADTVAWDRVGALLVIYMLGLGIGAHALDALGRAAGPKPWGEAFTRSQLRWTAGASLVAAYTIALYYIVRDAPWFAVVAVVEGFFAFAYNLEWFGGRFHTDTWFAVSWGGLPVLAGYVLQTNGLSLAALLVAAAAAGLSLVEITASRPYKALRRSPTRTDVEESLVWRYERILKAVSLGVIALGAGWALARWGG